MKDYSRYQFTVKQWVQYGLLYLCLDGCISYLFFYSGCAFFLLLPGCILFFREQKRTLRKKQEKQLLQQFLDGIQLMAAALQAGYSAENALREALRELKKMYGEGDFLVEEFQYMAVQTEIGRNLEQLFWDFARRSGLEDVKSFAEVFLTARRSGGDLLLIIRNTSSCIRQKQETMQEIETTLSGKIMEQNIMSAIPLLILAYVKLTSPEFFDGMYGNITGTTVMAICFGIYAAAYFWGRKIVAIQV